MILERPEFWRLRWRFEYVDGRLKYGQWDRHGDFETDQAWRQTKENLLYACVEGKEFHTKESKIFHRCLGQDFVNFNWMATSTVPSNFSGAVTPTPRIVGLTLIDRTKKHAVYKTGIIEVVDHGNDYSAKNLTGFGR